LISVIAEVLTNEEQLQEKLPSEIRPNTVSNCLDMCTGSGTARPQNCIILCFYHLIGCPKRAGALAIVLADVFPEAKIDAVDTSSHALEVARVNINNHRLNDTIELVLSDMFHSIRDKRYDVIVSNPPYVTKKSLDAFPEEFKKEPALAHFGGNDGLNFVELLLKEAPRHLTENGILIVEAVRVAILRILRSIYRVACIINVTDQLVVHS
jgi:HemK-like putative methylase